MFLTAPLVNECYISILFCLSPLQFSWRKRLLRWQCGTTTDPHPMTSWEKWVIASVFLQSQLLFPKLILFCLFFLLQVLIDLSNTSQLDNTPRWLPLKEQSESIEHSRAHHGIQGPPGSGAGQGHSAQGHLSGSGLGPGHSMGQGPEQGEGNYDSPINSVIKSRSHGIFPDPSKGKENTWLTKGKQVCRALGKK